ncbi:flavin reductase (DIM6/NTAB) family NADH-FMN oxidoreductase RutF/pimeloyl-ACP methyl ester carboxylesterase [Erythromicrobium ramosum]|uniref:Flavin reductase (DIM6/NTAB) family NADH-FMN oxidoreductase RutF/pimeloyl-ACP methyl ester carboxylesterase n=1 Tax=Erythrobacter ramosus TaxID=35811 RepID=A0ABR6I1W8_9SPHN|nr:alpha/beta fold hydrolase [Erythrobacter ramosus]MBB3776911.1 flavin reductase (DIM6/NTAB) family NADH-FMN oxidoreductase RutF/pimeloyl-ACP methyl ester carboxylesterase [Erythrobacter ramosus]
MTIHHFKGFGGVRLEADISGDENDPAILLVHGAGQTRAVWGTVAEGLVQAGRRVVSLDLRGHGGSEWPEGGRYDLAAHVEDLRAVLAQLGSRPVVVAATFGGWIASIALSVDGSNLAAGLVLVDMPVRSDPQVAKDIGERLRKVGTKVSDWDNRALDGVDLDAVSAQLLDAGPSLKLPTLVIRGGISWVRQAEGTKEFDKSLPDAEVFEVADADLLVMTDRTEALLAHLLDFLERKQPRTANEFRAGSDARTLRDAMGCFATGITVVTALGDDGAPIGLTANSFTSVSLDPPLLLVCIAKTSGTAHRLREAEHFAVNMLQTSQQPTSNRFAGKGQDRFAATAWHSGETGVPLLDGSLGSFECKRHAVHQGGDHFILIGEVVRAQYEPRRDPLLYFRGKYRRLHFA